MNETTTNNEETTTNNEETTKIEETTTVETTTLEETTLEETTQAEVEAIAETDAAGETTPIEPRTIPEETTLAEDVNTEETTALIEVPVDTTADADKMSMPFLGLSILQCAVAFFLIVIVLQQSKTATGITSSGAVGENQSYWSKNKGRSKESKLERMTVITGVIFFIVTLALGFIK